MKKKSNNYITAKYIIMISLSMAVFFAIIDIWISCNLRFDSTRLNHLMMVVCFTLPILCLKFARKIPIKKIWRLCFIVLIPIVIPSCFMLGVTIFKTCVFSYQIITSDIDITYMRIQSIDIGDSKIRVYEERYSITTRPKLVIRQEKQIIPGVNKVKILHKQYPADEVEIELLDNTQIQCYYPFYPTRPERYVTLKLDPDF